MDFLIAPVMLAEMTQQIHRHGAFLFITAQQVSLH
jgi:hypothetical protein